MAVNSGVDTFEEELHRILLAQLKEQAASFDVHHTRRLPYWVFLCCKKTKKNAALVGSCSVSDSCDQQELGVHRARQAVELWDKRVERQIIVYRMLCFGCLEDKSRTLLSCSTIKIHALSLIEAIVQTGQIRY